MRLLLDDTLASAPFVQPFLAGWVTPAAEVAVEARPDLRAADVGVGDAALLPVAELGALAASHVVASEAAVVAEGAGAVVLRTPVRPDEIERSPVRLLAASGTAELLARATLQPFYGISVTGWVRGDDHPAAAEVQAAVVEGSEALRPPEGGFAEDLVRAWFILVGLPFVSHVLVVPREVERADLGPLLATLETLRTAGQERRQEWRAALAEREGVARDRLSAFFAAQRLALAADDRRAIAALFGRGARGTPYAPAATIRYLEPEG